MAIRPIYLVNYEYPYYKCINQEFDWYSGFATSQKQKSIASLHNNFLAKYNKLNILEVSSKSDKMLGNKLSAFNLKKYVKSINQYVPVENIFQSSKVFEDDKQFEELLFVSPKESKRVVREYGKNIKKFRFEGNDYPINPLTIFYDYIYMNALLENNDLIEEVRKVDAFTDIEFNPNKSINCQAMALAKFVSLYRLGLIDKIKNFNDFYEIFKK